MKKFLMLLILLFLVYANCTEEKNIDELENATTVNVLIGMKEWEDAKDLLLELLQEYPDSKYRQNYYYSLNEVLGEQNYEKRLDYAKSNPPDTTKPRGSITLVITKNYGVEATRIVTERIAVAEKYLEEFPDGKFRDRFNKMLSHDYNAIGKKDEALKISRQLFNSSKIQNKINGAMKLGYNAHASKKYDDAIEYYEFVYENSEDLIIVIKFNFYTAVCFYELGDLEKSKQYLNIVFQLSEKTENKIVNKIAKIMLDYIDKFENKSQVPKRHFVFFVDEAN